MQSRSSLPGQIIILSAFVFLAACGEHKDKLAPDCRPEDCACVKSVGNDGLIVHFEVAPKPLKSMTEHFFIVTVKQKGSPVRDAAVLLDLTMPGMFMGTNKYVLAHSTDGIYSAKGVIPRCPGGNRIWQAEVIVGRKGVSSSVSYIFEVQD